MNTACHMACGYKFVILGRTYKPISVYRDDDTVDHFNNAILPVKEELSQKLLQVASMKLTTEVEELFEQAMEFRICQKSLGEKCVRVSRSHLFKIQRAAHPICNLNFKQSKVISVAFYNLRKYDAHHTMHRLVLYKILKFM